MQKYPERPLDRPEGSQIEAHEFSQTFVKSASNVRQEVLVEVF